MTNYNAIADAEIDPGSPITTSLVERLRDNPIAIAEGAAGAPRVDLSALDEATIGLSTMYHRSGIDQGPGTIYTSGWFTVGKTTLGIQWVDASQAYDEDWTLLTDAANANIDWRGFFAGAELHYDINDDPDGIIIHYYCTKSSNGIPGTGFRSEDVLFADGFVRLVETDVGTSISYVEAESRLDSGNYQIRFRALTIQSATPGDDVCKVLSSYKLMGD